MLQEKVVKYINIFIVGSLFGLFWIPVVAKASLFGDYVASSNAHKVDQRQTLGSGSRSNCQSLFKEKSITLMVPTSQVVHQTFSQRPLFYISSRVSSTVALKFSLIDPESPEPIVEKDFWLSKSGITEISLPQAVSLKEGKIYLWYVAVPCENNPEQYYEVLNAAVERVSLKEEIASAISQANTFQEKAAIYAKNGIWYDALEYALNQPSSYLDQLLSSAGITETTDFHLTNDKF